MFQYWVGRGGYDKTMRAIADFGWIETNLCLWYVLTNGHHAESAERLRTVSKNR